MTSKTFKNRVSVRDAESVLEIADTPAGIRITVREEDRIVSGWFNPDQGAEITLAILEAAGVEAKSHEAATVPYGTPAHLGMIASHLKAYAEAKSMNDAEAKDKAELEAEALGFFNEYRAAAQLEQISSWDEAHPLAKEQWLAVARKAREMRAEK